MSQEDLALRGSHRARRSDESTELAPRAVATLWESRAIELERIGMTLITQATSGKTPRMRDLSAGLKVLEAADKIWFRIGRAFPNRSAQKPAAPTGPTVDQPPSLSAYRSQHPRGGPLAARKTPYE